jgi:hypothetical protein
MADYYSSTVIQQTIPNVDMSPLERLLLTQIFESEPDGEGTYFFSSEGSCDVIWLDRQELEAALSESEEYESSVFAFVKDRLAETPNAESEVELDFSMKSWEPMFQDIIRRSSTLTQITAMTAFSCSKMRPDGFGGMVILITENLILGKSTDDVLCELMDQAEAATMATATKISDLSSPQHESPAAGQHCG